MLVLCLFSMPIPLICCCLRQQGSNLQSEIKVPGDIKKTMFIWFFSVCWFYHYSACRSPKLYLATLKQRNNWTNCCPIKLILLKSTSCPFVAAATTHIYTQDFLRT